MIYFERFGKAIKQSLSLSKGDVCYFVIVSNGFSSEITGAPSFKPLTHDLSNVEIEYIEYFESDINGLNVFIPEYDTYFKFEKGGNKVD